MSHGLYSLQPIPTEQVWLPQEVLWFVQTADVYQGALLECRSAKLFPCMAQPKDWGPELYKH